MFSPTSIVYFLDTGIVSPPAHDWFLCFISPTFLDISLFNLPTTHFQRLLRQLCLDDSLHHHESSSPHKGAYEPSVEASSTSLHSFTTEAGSSMFFYLKMCVERLRLSASNSLPQ